MYNVSEHFTYKLCLCKLICPDRQDGNLVTFFMYITKIVFPVSLCLRILFSKYLDYGAFGRRDFCSRI